MLEQNNDDRWISQGVEQDVVEIIKRWSPYKGDSHFSMDTYLKNKKDFFLDFNSNLSISERVSTVASDLFKEQFNTFLEKVWDVSKPLFNFITENTLEGFIENVVIKNFKVFSTDGMTQIKISKGMKLTRSFKLFLSAPESKSDLYGLELTYSQLASKFKLGGVLSLSIHPLDYLSISMNSLSWRSCQSLDGEFAAGVFSLMNDRCTLVAYVSNETPVDVFDCRKVLWNSKKWRALVHIDNSRNLVAISKHYPFESSHIESQLIKLIEKLYNKTFNLKTDYELDELNPVMGTGKGASNYNDMRHSSKGHVYQYKNEEFDKIIVGKAVPCFGCGTSIITVPEQYACDDCAQEGKQECSLCEGMMWEDELTFIPQEDRVVCQNCLEYEYFFCEKCCEFVANSGCSDNNHSNYCNSCRRE